MSPPDYLLRNRRAWDRLAEGYVAAGRACWAGPAHWGIWSVPDAQLRVLDDDMTGLDAVELGCGTAYVCAWMAKRGAHCVGIDNAPNQLATARRLQDEFGLHFPLLHTSAEALPFADESFDIAISEYGAAIWSDPHLWLPEAARVLRPGGRLIFLGHSPLMTMCAFDEDAVAATPTLKRPYFGMHRVEWAEQDAVAFCLPHGEMIELLRANAFEVVGLKELRAPVNATTRYDHVDLTWSRQWPCEDIWLAQKR